MTKIQLKTAHTTQMINITKEVKMMMDPDAAFSEPAEGEEEIFMEEEEGSNWWIWVVLGGTALAGWYIFKRKKS